MSIPHQATITYRPGNYRARVMFPYHPLAVERIKAALPSHDRGWDGERKVWSIAPPWLPTARRILIDVFGHCRLDAPASAEPTPIRGDAAIYAELHLLPSAQAALIESAYRCLARVAHPDAGGSDDARMRRLNDAVAMLRQWVAS